MDATTFFLTYPRSNLGKELVWERLNLVKPAVWARVAVEEHADGEPHVHVLIKYGARVRTRSDVRIFDIEGRHPNVQVARGIRAVLQYISKGSNYSDFGRVPVGISEEHTTTSERVEKAVELARAGGRSAYDSYALGIGLSFAWARHIWEREGTPDTHTILEGGSGIMCMQLQSLQWSPGTCIVVGPTGCGKSTWAKERCPKPGLWVSHIDDLRRFRLGHHKSIIFDDMCFQHLPRTAQIHLVDQDDVRSIHVRYGTVTIPAGTDKIFTANEYPFADDAAIKRRVRTTNIISFAI